MKSHRLFVPQSMIPAMLSGAKTQHRIPLKRQPPDGETLQVGIYHPTRVRKDGEEYPGPAAFGCFTPDGDWALPCLYRPGDEVWVAESLYAKPSAYGVGVAYVAGGHFCLRGPGSVDVANPSPGVLHHIEGAKWPWPSRRIMPAATMPRWAARIVRAVKAVRVERVQDISEAGAVAEGITNHAVTQYWNPSRGAEMQPHQHGFMLWWDRIHGPGAWDRNDWVWVPTFTTKETTR